MRKHVAECALYPAANLAKTVAGSVGVPSDTPRPGKIGTKCDRE